MLVGPEFVVASPTKTGTKSLNHLARTNPELGLRYVAPGHRMTVPNECAHLRRYMVVRDPYARLVSIYVYLRRRVGDWGNREAVALGFVPWLDHFLDLRRRFDPSAYDAQAPSIWLCTQHECWRILEGERFWKLEAVGDFLANVGIKATIPVLNSGEARPPVEQMFPASCRERVWNEWARMDCTTFGYARL